jgi:hypothetical protein
MDTNPMGVSGDAAAEEALARMFGDEKPEASEDTEEEVVDDQPSEEPEEEEEASEDAPEESKEDTEELDIDGFKVSLPKEKAEKLKSERLMHADYTRKTQEVAETRKVLEEKAQLLEVTEQARAATFKKAVEVDRLEKQLAEYEKVDWIALADQDPAQATKFSMHFQALQRQHATAMNDLRSSYQQVQQTTEKARQQTLANTLKAVKEAIPGFNDEVDRQLEKHAQEYGAGAFERDAFLKSPALVRMAFNSMQWEKLQASKPALNKKAAEAKQLVKTTSRGIQQTQAASKVKESFALARKSGKSDDVENALARLFEQKRKR